MTAGIRHQLLIKLNELGALTAFRPQTFPHLAGCATLHHECIIALTLHKGEKASCQRPLVLLEPKESYREASNLHNPLYKRGAFASYATGAAQPLTGVSR